MSKIGCRFYIFLVNLFNACSIHACLWFNDCKWNSQFHTREVWIHSQIQLPKVVTHHHRVYTLSLVQWILTGKFNPIWKYAFLRLGRIHLFITACFFKLFIILSLYSTLVSWSYSWLFIYCDVIIGANASQITRLTIVYSTVYSGSDQRKHQSSASLAVVRGINRRPVNSPHKWPVTRKMFPFDDFIIGFRMWTICREIYWNPKSDQCAISVTYSAFDIASMLFRW